MRRSKRRSRRQDDFVVGKVLDHRALCLLEWNFRCAKCNGSQRLTVHHVHRLNVKKKFRRMMGKRRNRFTTHVGLVPLCEVCHVEWHKLEEKNPDYNFGEWLEENHGYDVEGGSQCTDQGEGVPEDSQRTDGRAGAGGVGDQDVEASPQFSD